MACNQRQLAADVPKPVAARDPDQPLLPLLVDFIHGEADVVAFLHETERQLHTALAGLLNGENETARVACDALWAAFTAARKMAESHLNELAAAQRH